MFTSNKSKALATSLATTLLLIAGAASASPAAEARADIQKTLGFVPQFFLDVPEVALPGTWQEMKTLQMNPKTALPGKAKELIGLAVAAQVPCRYCISAHTEFGKLNGASKAEIGEAVAMAGITRHWSTFLNGIQTDEAAFKSEISRVVDGAKKAAAGPKTAPPAPIAVVDGQTALKDVAQTMGFAPDFLKRFPDVARAAAWRTMKDLQMSETAISPKNKELIGLAVASQVPCKFCIIAHTEFAKLNGATDAEINETVAMAAFTRQMSTLLNGLQTDERQFNKDIARLVAGAKAHAAKAAKAEDKLQTAAARTQQ